MHFKICVFMCIVCACMYMHVCMQTHRCIPTTAHRWESEDNLTDQFLLSALFKARVFFFQFYVLQANWTASFQGMMATLVCEFDTTGKRHRRLRHHLQQIPP